MIYELRIDAGSDQELADTLTKFVDAIRGLPTNNVFSFTRYGGIQSNGNGGLPLTQEAFEAAAKASQDNAAPAPAKRGRPPKSAAPTATIVETPDGEPAAAMEESPFGAAPPDETQGALTADQKREKAISILMSVFAHPAGPPGVRTLQTKLKVKKFTEVPDEEVDTLLSSAEQLYARIQATPGAAA